ncbi:uncharacterized protein AMSG_01504 [Thecamonas trahens ATCC 50062]|uniref:Uncharacterized protein n=1 Tax=Thecamonas trahens ATCC 50062 TaxID=461836 RepID=A0A0L0DRL9_THETB|nr:hypothetical protein AMSG_01504 [Thecamonas trahens ATCC 50062]KNC54651.1 hypothetical protein AMSG_01504 [Thecamonas trahens ATCC 50062]|eukprot:XP_013761556.1 hypothetical protein AMSG_01504 [Thecamonas trahens ATCC 50062]
MPPLVDSAALSGLALFAIVLTFASALPPPAPTLTFASLIAPAPPLRHDACAVWIAAPHTPCFDLTDTPCAPDTMPPALTDAFSMGGAVDTSHSMVIDDTMGGKGSRYGASEESVTALALAASARHARLAAAAAAAGSYHALAASLSATGFHDRKDLLRIALLAVNASRPGGLAALAPAAVFGSMSPWIEAELLALGLDAVTTVEYNTLNYRATSITTLTPDQLATNIADGTHTPFGLAISLSSFDHDGLGRYGDPLSPSADLDIMAALADCILAPHGVLVVSVPVGSDQLVWNMHRRYGPARLPSLLAPFLPALDPSPLIPLVDASSVLGWDSDARLSQDRPFTSSYEPVFILSPLDQAPLHTDREL